MNLIGVGTGEQQSRRGMHLTYKNYLYFLIEQSNAL